MFSKFGHVYPWIYTSHHKTSTIVYGSFHLDFILVLHESFAIFFLKFFSPTSKGSQLQLWKLCHIYTLAHITVFYYFSYSFKMCGRYKLAATVAPFCPEYSDQEAPLSLAKILSHHGNPIQFLPGRPQQQLPSWVWLERANFFKNV